MIERKGDMFAEYLSPEVIYVITTNGYVKNDGSAVMGRGTALVAAQINKSLPKVLGDLLLSHGNRPFLLPGNFVSLPVKHKWDEKADLGLIDMSLQHLYSLLVHYWTPERKVYLPRPGCGNGQLSWDTVQPFVEDFVRACSDTGRYGIPVTVWSL